MILSKILNRGTGIFSEHFTQREIPILFAFLSLSIALQIVAIHEQSLSGDGAYHLVAGHQALRYGQNLINLEHPPLVKLVIALPLWFEHEPLLPLTRLEGVLWNINRIYENPSLVRRGTLRGRYMMLFCFVLPFWVCCYLLGRKFGDPRTGMLLSFMVAFSLSILPNFPILQTDTAVSLGYLFTLLAAYRLWETGSFKSATLLGLAFGFTLSVKFSGLLLAPTILLAVGLTKRKGQPWWRSVVLLVLITIVAYMFLNLTYWLANWNYHSQEGRETIHDYCHGKGTLVVQDRMQPFEEMLLTIETLQPRLAQWLTGLLGIHSQNVIGIYPSYAFGEISFKGRWWYFPVLLLVKTPLVILFAALIIVVRRFKSFCLWSEAYKPLVQRAGLIILTVLAYLGTAITSNYNLGVRHMMPVIPLLYLPIAATVSRNRIGTALMVGLLAGESLMLSPLWMSATNTWWLGSHNPTRFVFSSGIEYRQNYIQLAKFVEKHNIKSLRVIIPGIGQRFLRTYLPDAHAVQLDDPLEPGWYAVNTKVEQFIPALLREPVGPYSSSLINLAKQWELYWQRVTRGKDYGYVAGTFHLYYLDTVPLADNMPDP